MAIERRRHLLLGALVVVLAVVVYRAVATTPGPSTNAASPSNVQGRGSSSSGGSVSGPTAPDVHLRALDSEKPKPGVVKRNLFRFKPKAPPPAPVVAPIRPAPVDTAPPGPPPPPPLPPIALKFIGIVDEGPGKPKIAVLSDSTGHVFHGTENGTPILGQYRILRIGAESIEMSYLDGRGRQTIRLTGS